MFTEKKYKYKNGDTRTSIRPTLILYNIYYIQIVH